MKAVYVYLAVATSACLCLITSGVESQINSLSSYSKLRRAALRVAKRHCHIEQNKETKVCIDFKKAVAAFQSDLLSKYNDEVITEAAINSAGSKDKQNHGSTKGGNKHNSGKDKNGKGNTQNTGTGTTQNTGTGNTQTGNNEDTGQAGFFGNPGISLG